LRELSSCVPVESVLSPLVDAPLTAGVAGFSDASIFFAGFIVFAPSDIFFSAASDPLSVVRAGAEVNLPFATGVAALEAACGGLVGGPDGFVAGVGGGVGLAGGAGGLTGGAEAFADIEPSVVDFVSGDFSFVTPAAARACPAKEAVAREGRGCIGGFAGT